MHKLLLFIYLASADNDQWSEMRNPKHENEKKTFETKTNKSIHVKQKAIRFEVMCEY